MPSSGEHYRIIDSKSSPDQRLHYVACPLCLADDPAELFRARDHYNDLPGEFPVVRCAECGFVYTNPRPSGEALQAFYPDDAGYYQPDVDADSLRRKALSGKRYRALRRSMGYGDASDAGGRPALAAAPRGLLRRGYPRFVAGGKLLEVGCSYGKFLFQLKCMGWDVEGIELNEAAAAFAREHLGLTVTTSPVEASDLADNAYDAVVMQMVLEHIPAPVSCLQRLHRAMKPGGELIVAVPNFASRVIDLFGEHAYFLHVPQHMSHFTPETLGRTFEESGFRTTGVFGIPSKRDITQSARTRLSEGQGDWVTKIAASRPFAKTLLPLLLAWSRCRGRSTRMMVYAERV